MGLRLRISRQTLDLLEALLLQPSQWHHGYALSQSTGLASGTLYPILMRLEKSGWLETRWEDTPSPGRPPRHLYRLSGNGREWAREETPRRTANEILEARSRKGVTCLPRVHRSPKPSLSNPSN